MRPGLRAEGRKHAGDSVVEVMSVKFEKEAQEGSSEGDQGDHLDLLAVGS